VIKVAVLTLKYYNKNMRSMTAFRIRHCFFFIIVLLYVFSEGGEQKQRTFGFTELEPSGVDRYDAKVYSQILRWSIANLNVYSTLEFSDVTTGLAQQDLPNTCNTPRCAIIAGQILSVDVFGFGTIGKIGKTFTISMQLVDVHTGKTVVNISEFYKGRKKKFKSEIIPLFAHRICGIEPEKEKKK
jgi:hypothetical protein